VRSRGDTRDKTEKALTWERAELRKAAESARRLAQSAAVDLSRAGTGTVLSEPVLVLSGRHGDRVMGIHGGSGRLVALATRNGAIRIMQRDDRLLDDRGDQLDGPEVFSVQLGARWADLLFGLKAPHGGEMGVVRRRVDGARPGAEQAYDGRYRRCPVIAASARMGTVAMPVGRLGFTHPTRDWYVEQFPDRPLARIVCAERDPERVGYVADLDDRATSLQRAIAVGTMLAAEAKRIVPTH
jgi:hypothetical protein